MTGALSRRRDGEERAWLRGAPPPRWVRWLPIALLVALCTAQLVTEEKLDLGFLLGRSRRWPPSPTGPPPRRCSAAS